VRKKNQKEKPGGQRRSGVHCREMGCAADQGTFTVFAPNSGVRRWKGEDSLLLFRERKAYLAAVQDAIAGTDEARVVLAKVVQRREKG
jgi:hypothetical protein